MAARPIVPEQGAQYGISPYFEDLTGKTFGQVTVEAFSHEPRPYCRYWRCRCVCGRTRILREDYVKRGLVSCASCRRLEIASRQGPRRCPSCARSLPRSRFYKDRSTVDGLRRYCIDCSRSKAATLLARRRRRRPEDIVLPREKMCRECRLTKPAEEFWTDRASADGLARRCSDCKMAQQRQWYERSGKAKRLPVVRLARYKMSRDDLEALLAVQGMKCPICGKAFDGPKSFHIDHDHKADIVRGVLCPKCNNGLGAFSDSIVKLYGAIHYLRRYRARHLTQGLPQTSTEAAAFGPLFAFDPTATPKP